MIAARQQYMVPFIKAFSGEKRNSNRIFWSRVDGTLMSMMIGTTVQWYCIPKKKDGYQRFTSINQTNAPARLRLP